MEEAKTDPKNMVAYKVWAIDSKSEVRSDLWGRLEDVVASEATKGSKTYNLYAEFVMEGCGLVSVRAVELRTHQLTPAMQ